jgi:hypothetical protein
MAFSTSLPWSEYLWAPPTFLVSIFHWLKHLYLRSFNFVGIQVNVSKYVGIVNHTSHPHVMDDGTLYNLGISFSLTGPHYSIVKFPPPCNVSSAGTYTLPITVHILTLYYLLLCPCACHNYNCFCLIVVMMNLHSYLVKLLLNMSKLSL